MLRSSVDTCFPPSLSSVIRSFAVIHFSNKSHSNTVAFHPPLRTHARTRMYAHICARARDIYPDAASNDFTLPSSNRAALRLSFSIIRPPGVTHYPPCTPEPPFRSKDIILFSLNKSTDYDLKQKKETYITTKDMHQLTTRRC